MDAITNEASTAASLSGKTLEFYAPSGFKVVIREQNGEDEDIISNTKKLLAGDAVHHFLAGIIQTIDDKKVSSKDVENLRTRDKFYIMLKSRMFSLGHIIQYSHQCSNPNCNKPDGAKDPVFEEDLSLYDKDFSPEAKEDKREDFKYRIEPYLNPHRTRELTLSTGKVFRYKHLTGAEEKKSLTISTENITKNQDILLREPHWLDTETTKFQPLQNFKMYSSREMAEIRKDIALHDLPFEVVSECKCPYCNNIDKISLVTQSDFFFPGEI